MLVIMYQIAIHAVIQSIDDETKFSIDISKITCIHNLYRQNYI